MREGRSVTRKVVKPFEFSSSPEISPDSTTTFGFLRITFWCMKGSANRRDIISAQLNTKEI